MHGQHDGRAEEIQVDGRCRAVAKDHRVRGERQLPFPDLLERLGVAEVEARAGHLVAEARLVQQLRQRRRVRAAGAAVLDEHHHHHLRIVARRERREPGVVAVLERQRRRLDPARVRDDLHACRSCRRCSALRTRALPPVPPCSLTTFQSPSRTALQCRRRELSLRAARGSERGSVCTSRPSARGRRSGRRAAGTPCRRWRRRRSCSPPAAA